MPVLEMREATFRRADSTLFAPLTMTIDYGACAELTCDTTISAGIAARLAAGIMKCTEGNVFVADFDPKIQPVQVKALVGFLPSERPRNPLPAEEYFAYRAALWGLEKTASMQKGRTLLAMLDGLEPGEAALLAGIFLHGPRLLVLERPRDGVRDAAEALKAVTPPSALFITYGPSDRAAFDIRAQSPTLGTAPS
ncbi:MAG: hypothetical protein ABR584_03190 [Candidatus Baltobacteraceae bacterium]